MAYGFPLDNLESQITQFLFELEKDYFFKLSKLEFDDLGNITTLLLKFQDRMSAICTKQNELSSKFKQY